jgi:two-component system, cell cycle sensor histidine kinase and response regulator CckA
MQAATRESTTTVELDVTFEAIATLDASGRVLHSTAAIGAALDLPPERAVAQQLGDVLSATDRLRLQRALAELASHELSPPFRVSTAHTTSEWRLRRLYGDSAACIVEARALPVAREASEETSLAPERGALQQKSAELEAILRALPDLFFRFDTEGRFLDFSAKEDSRLYAPPALFLGKRPSDVMPPALAAAMERTRAETHATGSLVTLEYEIEIDGKRHYCEARYVPHLDGQTIALVRDVTCRREAEVALRASEIRLRESQKLDAVGRLAGGVAHDFNNLLMIILGYTTAAARHVPRPHPAASAIEEIGKAVDRATALTKQLLALSRRQPVQPTILDLGTILHDMVRMLGRVIGEHIALSAVAAPGLARVNADRSQIEQVILNLVLNARDAMPSGGQLSIRAENVGKSGPQVALIVSDSGEGMSEETCARIFEPFFTTKARGTGLGLFTVRQIVDEYTGSITVQSRLGEGTRFTITLPAVYEPPAPIAREPRKGVRGGNETVLVVEDEEPVRALLVDILSQLGYGVLAAASPQEALERLASEPRDLDLLLTDVVMPGSNGWELATQVLALRPRCRVLYMSGHPVEADASAARRIAHGALLHKPFAPSALAARIRQILDTR